MSFDGERKRAVPIVEKLYNNAQQSYATAGGFHDDDDDDERGVARSKRLRRRAAPAGRADSPPSACELCDKPFPSSFLLDSFGVVVCDDCRQPDTLHALLTRTEAKSAYLLKDADLDLRPPPLRFVSRKNPHNSRWGDMKLYLKLQVEERVLQVWQSWDALEAEKEARLAKAERLRDKRLGKKLKSLRAEVRGEVKQVAAHEHRFDDECYDAASDTYSQSCLDCSHRVTFEKM